MAFNLFPQTDFRQMDLNYVLEVSKQAAANLEEYAADKEQVVATQAAAEEALAAAQQDIQTATQAAASAGQDAQTATQAAGTATQKAESASQDAQTASEAAQTAQHVQESIPADYTQLSNDVDALKSDLNEITETIGYQYVQVSNVTKYPDERWYYPTGTGPTASGGTGKTAIEFPCDPLADYDICGKYAGTSDGYPIFIMDESYTILDTIITAEQITVDGEDRHTLFTTPANAAIIRYNIATDATYDSQRKKVASIAPKGYEALEATVSQVASMHTTVTSKNLLNPETMTEGLLKANGTISTEGSYANYLTSDYIEIDESTNYTLSLWSLDLQTLVTYAREAGALFDSDKQIISGTYQNVNPASYLTFNHASAKYIRVSCPTGNAMMLEKASAPTYFASYSVKEYSTLFTEESKQPYKNVLYGKKWAVCGDSFTNGATTTKMSVGEKYEGKNYTYPWIIGRRQNMEIAQFFLGGRTLAFPAEPGAFVNSLTNPNADCYYQNIPSDADYITFYIGINDAHHAPGSSGGDGEDNTGEIPIGTIDDNTTATYYGAWNVVIPWLITNRPNAHIGIIVTNGISGDDAYRQAQIAIATKYAIPYIDLNGDARTPAMIRTSNPNIPSAIKTALINKWAVDPSSNTHPNDAAHLFESTCIENFLRSL